MPDVNKLEAHARKLIEAGLQELYEQDPTGGSQQTATGINWIQNGS